MNRTCNDCKYSKESDGTLYCTIQGNNINRVPADTLCNSWDCKSKVQVYEEYRLTLEHYIIQSDGTKFMIDEPIVARSIQCNDLLTNGAYLINRTFDRMRHEILEYVRAK